ncbi:hypothetical protein ACLQ2R_08800 [Streptosporangium sp. DT93]|uniref:hypothetical protein n=1 Tax=Streptosporangium sp. DT93 TaxID=3393428 RepID=UPI003CEEEA3C
MTQDERMSPAEALARAGELDTLVRRRSRWYVRYLLVFGVSALALVLVLGFTSTVTPKMVSTGLWLALVAVLTVHAVRQPVIRRGFGVRHTVIIVTWGVLYAGVLLAGSAWFQGEPAWWVPGAVVVSLPAFVGAYLEARR